MELKFNIHDQENSEDAKLILNGIRQFNDPYRTEDWRELTITAKNGDGEIVAGLNGNTDWGWLFVKLLWVAEEARGHDIGTQLMKEAEDEAKLRGCHSAWLDTFSFQAKGFYEKLGYSSFGMLDDFPRGHQRFFLRKKII